MLTHTFCVHLFFSQGVSTILQLAIITINVPKYPLFGPGATILLLPGCCRPLPSLMRPIVVKNSNSALAMFSFRHKQMKTADAYRYETCWKGSNVIISIGFFSGSKDLWRKVQKGSEKLSSTPTISCALSSLPSCFLVGNNT
ncbi:hypothetical protein BDN71DRAFT_806559 [Pleurotus eryngii]|uniref:Uncharacterized protein n=1 Tax=Pleurotus eryngii TaxID=5323 RepID=A0A9P6DFW7_PLEER|nr:hypothetical protein BDN71DRAFT_806559 [Pleurotus eryngii]